MVSESRCYFQLNRRPIAALSRLTARAQFVQHHGKDDDRALDDQLPVEGEKSSRYVLLEGSYRVAQARITQLRAGSW